MNATLLTPHVEPSQQTLPCCENCPAVQRLEAMVERLLTDYRRDVAYWKSMHERALQRIERLEEELEQSQGEVRELKPSSMVVSRRKPPRPTVPMI